MKCNADSALAFISFFFSISPLVLFNLNFWEKINTFLYKKWSLFNCFLCLVEVRLG
jgi:hypothetical protein